MPEKFNLLWRSHDNIWRFTVLNHAICNLLDYSLFLIALHLFVSCCLHLVSFVIHSICLRRVTSSLYWFGSFAFRKWLHHFHQNECQHFDGFLFTIQSLRSTSVFNRSCVYRVPFPFVQDSFSFFGSRCFWMLSEDTSWPKPNWSPDKYAFKNTKRYSTRKKIANPHIRKEESMSRIK